MSKINNSKGTALFFFNSWKAIAEALITVKTGMARNACSWPSPVSALGELKLSTMKSLQSEADPSLGHALEIQEQGFECSTGNDWMVAFQFFWEFNAGSEVGQTKDYTLFDQ